jgi:chemotaxis protein MotA
MNHSALIGLVLAPAIVMVAVRSGLSTYGYLNPTAALVTIGGTLAVTLIQFPLSTVFRSLNIVAQCFLTAPLSEKKLRETFRTWLQMVRNEDTAALENEIHDLRNPMLIRGLRLILHSETTTSEMETGLKDESRDVLSELETTCSLVRCTAVAAPACGMIATMISLTEMLKALNDPATIGTNAAAALMACLYGMFLSQMIAMPLAGLVLRRAQQEQIQHGLILDGFLELSEKQSAISVRGQFLKSTGVNRSTGRDAAEHSGRREAASEHTDRGAGVDLKPSASGTYGKRRAA